MSEYKFISYKELQSRINTSDLFRRTIGQDRCLENYICVSKYISNSHYVGWAIYEEAFIEEMTVQEYIDRYITAEINLEDPSDLIYFLIINNLIYTTNNKKIKGEIMEETKKQIQARLDEKPDHSFMVKVFMDEVSKVMMEGGSKYGRYNYYSGDKNLTWTAAMSRHIKQYEDGEDRCSESNLKHIAHVAANCLILLHQEHLGTLIDARYKPKKDK